MEQCESCSVDQCNVCNAEPDDLSLAVEQLYYRPKCDYGCVLRMVRGGSGGDSEHDNA